MFEWRFTNRSMKKQQIQSRLQSSYNKWKNEQMNKWKNEFKNSWIRTPGGVREKLPKNMTWLYFAFLPKPNLIPGAIRTFLGEGFANRCDGHEIQKKTRISREHSLPKMYDFFGNRSHIQDLTHVFCQKSAAYPAIISVQADLLKTSSLFNFQWISHNIEW